MFAININRRFADVTLALREARRPHGGYERDRGEPEGTRRDGNGVRHGLSVDAAAYESYVSIAFILISRYTVRYARARDLLVLVIRCRTTPEHSREVSEEPMEQDEAK